MPLLTPSPAAPPVISSSASDPEHPFLPHLKQVHARALRTYSTGHCFILFNRIARFSSPADGDHLDYASRLLLDRLIVPDNSFPWNTLIRAYARTTDRKHASLHLYHRMLVHGDMPPDKYTYPFVLKACAFLSAFSPGMQLHGHVLKLGFASDVYVNNSLIHFYASCGSLDLARFLFDEMPLRNLVSWNIMVDGYVMCGDYGTALALFREMQKNGFTPDEFTFQSIVCACGGLGALSLGMWAHVFVLRNCCVDAVSDVLLNNSLIDMYSRCGSIAIARKLFRGMPSRDLASWNAMILGFAMHGLVKDSLETFATMFDEMNLKPNSITFIGVLSACNHGGLVGEGQRYFKLMISEFGIEPQIEHYGCMVDLFARAGYIDEALDLISDMPCKPDAVIWRSLLDACWKGNAGIDVSESVARRVLELEDGVTSGAYVLLSRVYASAKLWNDVGLVRRLMVEEGIRKEPGCSSVEMDGVVYEFVAGDTSHPDSKEIYETLQVVEDQLASAGHVPDLSQAPMIAENNGEKQQSLRLHSERLAIAFGLLKRTSRTTSIRILKNLRVCRDCHAMTKLISSVFHVEIIIRDRARFHHFKDGSCSCSDYW